MKKLILLSAIAASSLMYQSASAQIHVGLHINLGSPVVYAPAPVYHEPAPVYNDVDYYYLPDVEAYYSVSRHCYYYNDGRTWVSAAYLPGAYRDYDISRARRFEVREARPYLRNDVYRQRFGGVANRDWNRAYDRERMYANRDRDYRNQYQRDDRRDNDHRDYQQNNGNRDNRGQGQYQQNGGNNNRGPQQGNQQNNNRGNHFGRDSHGI
ncbi:PXPV repeat protein [Mucilaginibacter sp. HMF5004]|uniref:PXPV repeat protein n=1 Tax=Mucilaginibacter rivuli TaxID=2857527 RepID=UPI001C5F1544|nr:PXPV repeat protein [Mucilaginibacter rivuli]MBW4891335.1 PXPV repeat protein [Mucilaginibacter rivuli]